MKGVVRTFHTEGTEISRANGKRDLESQEVHWRKWKSQWGYSQGTREKHCEIRGRGSFIKVFAVSPKRNDIPLLSHDGSLTSRCLVSIC